MANSWISSCNLWCRYRDSNSDGGTHQILSLARLPIPPYLQETVFFNELVILSLFHHSVNYNNPPCCGKVEMSYSSKIEMSYAFTLKALLVVIKPSFLRISWQLDSVATA